ncbi:MAG: CoB--CoM heterodisulfide reductase iron-sulfur subunit B family protein, partial [Deltaproteobacteria bacterium]|nr:CoB--CoM heterodisulfide reductase iron-sulfur subunit B family protein [Deltaproteobacteria bacterium]
MKVAYYPGCSLEGTARDYSESVHGICSHLDVELEEIPDWNCCGATAAHSIDHKASIELCGRTLNLASQMPHSNLLVPCPMCFNRLKTAVWTLQGEHKNRYEFQIEGELPKIWDLANFFGTEALLETLAKHVKKPLEGLKVVCYYGCMSNRPPEITEEVNYENPQSMDRIVQKLGATVIPWPYKTDCCGASQVLSRLDIVSKLVGKLYDMAQRVGAEAIVVSCQMCQANLDMYQKKFENDWGRTFSLPIYYFSELIGLACDVKGVKKWLSRHIT